MVEAVLAIQKLNSMLKSAEKSKFASSSDLVGLHTFSCRHLRPRRTTMERESDATTIREMAPYTADVLNPFVLEQRLHFLDKMRIAVLSVTLLPLRLLLMSSVLLLAWLVGIVPLMGISKAQALGLEPLSGWRRHWAKPFISELARLVFFFGGWYWIPQKGHRATAKEAPVLLVMPHSSFLDTVLVIALRCPGMVVKDSTERAPLFGRLVKYAQPLFVRSEDPESRKKIADEIQQRVTSDRDWEQLLLFPEGGCANRKALLKFKLGGFSPGVPVQPVFIRYKNKLDTFTWTWEGPGALKQIWLTLTQFYINCELEFLPVYHPSKKEKEDARFFADNVQKYISRWTETPITHFSIEDARYLKMTKDQELPPTVALVKFLKLRKAIGHQDMDPVDELRHLKEIRSSSDNSMPGDASQMAAYIGLDNCPEALKDFYQVLDQHGGKCLDVRVYDAALCLLRTDIEKGERLEHALQAFGREPKPEHLESILLLWRGVPSSMASFKTFGSLERDTTELDGS